MVRRVLHIVSRFEIGGTERQLVERLRRHPRGFEPLLACSDASGKFLPMIRALGIEPIVIPLRGLAHYTAGLAILRIAALIRSHKVDLVHANDLTMSALGLSAARLAGVSVVVNRVDMGHLRPGMTIWHRRMEMFAARHADICCANAEAVRRMCIEEEGCHPDRVVVVRNGLDLPRFDELAAQPGDPLPLEPGDSMVAVIGNLWPVKGHRVLVEAAALLRERWPKVRFFCAGEGSEKAALQKRIRELGLERTVVLLGHRIDVPSLLRRADAFILCSSAEGLSNAVMEAMAARLPVVATDVGGNGELLEGGRGVLVPYGDPQALAGALDRIFTDPVAAQAMGRRARAFIESELTLDGMQSAHEQLYLRALEPSARWIGEEPCSTP
jgi:glycosyltransferase involved in cell wall biosynthesis